MTSSAVDPFAEFIAAYPPEVRQLAVLARVLIKDVIPNAIEQYDAPAKLIAYGYDRTYKGLVCAIALQKTYVNVMFAKGASLPDPAGLLDGTGKRARHVKLRQPEDVARPGVRTLLESAVAAMEK